MTASITRRRVKGTEDICMGVTMKVKLGKERSEDIRGITDSLKVVGSISHNCGYFYVQ